MALRFDPRYSSLRGLGSGSVMLSHALAVAGAVSYSWLGWGGVGLFLALSVYLLMGSLDSGTTLRRYFVRRATRIWPLYWAACAAVFALADRSWEHLALNAAFLGIWVPGGQFSTGTSWDPNYVLWTLQVEELMYLTFPVIHRLSAKWRVRAGWGMVAFSAAFFVATAAAPGTYASDNAYYLPFGWLCCYGAGLLAYQGVRLRRWRRWLALAPVAVVATGAVPYQAGLFLLLPLYVAALTDPPRWLKAWPLVVLGEASYALYLFHALWLQFAGLVLGVPGALGTAFGAEWASRRKEMRRRLLAVL